MTNEIIEELEKIALECKEITDNPRYYLDWGQLARLKANIRILNDLVRKINEELN